MKSRSARPGRPSGRPWRIAPRSTGPSHGTTSGQFCGKSNPERTAATHLHCFAEALKPGCCPGWKGVCCPMSAPRKYDDELRERAVRLVFESGRPVALVARDLGVHRETLRLWVRQAEADNGSRQDRLTTQERERLRALEEENRELNMSGRREAPGAARTGRLAWFPPAPHRSVHAALPQTARRRLFTGRHAAGAATAGWVVARGRFR